MSFRSRLKGSFDSAFYNSQCGRSFSPAEGLRHYLESGWLEGLDPTPTFSTRAYLERYPDIAATGANPFAHYLRFGASEKRLAVASGVLHDVEMLPPEEDVSRILPKFDSGFYNNQTRRSFSEIDGARHYLSAGWRAGLDPSANFSTKAYLEAHPELADRGENPFLHYLSQGRKKQNAVTGSAGLFDADADYPTAEEAEALLPYFDENFYNKQVARSFSAIDAARHYLGKGWKLGLDPSLEFSTKAYLRFNPDVVEADMNPLLHYIRFGKAAGRTAYPSNTPLDALPLAHEKTQWESPQGKIVAQHFDLHYYQQQTGQFELTSDAAVEHYLTEGWKLGLSPVPSFSPADYLAMYPDVKASGADPYWHYVSQGIQEGRQPRRGGDKSENGRQILEDIRHKRVDGVTEWRDYDHVAARGWQSLESREPDLSSLDFTMTFAGLDSVDALAGLDLSLCAGEDGDEVDVSIIIPTINESEVLVECLASIAQSATDRLRLEVIVVDNGSSDDLYSHLAQHPHLRYLRFDKNLGFGNACNAGAEMARGAYLFFLNNDAQISPDCLEKLVATHKKNRAGMVGPKILSFDGRLQEAGCILKSDGTGQLIGYGHNPNVPRFNYRREVEHLSGAAILLKRDLFRAVGGFDPIYAPAYCEDADLSLKIRAKGHVLIYEPKAVVAHHLSKTSNANSDKTRSKRQRISRNRQTLVSRWSETLAETRLRTIAFYLPQYHPIPENDLWWGKGFTEWTNLGRALPNFEGHVQPRIPADLGYYDLRRLEVMEEQTALARRNGLSGFCYYYYNFDGKRLLETPLEQMLKAGKPDFPFCLCWANENWTKRWDGRSKDVLMKQSYSDESMRAIINDILRYCAAPNYIRVNGKPLILIYRVSDLPNPKRAIATWRNVARQAGIGDIMIASVESFELSSSPADPKLFGCDISVEFPPHDMVRSPPLNVVTTNPDWTGTAHDYRELAINYMTREEVGFKRLRSVLVGWDNTPRYRDRSMVLEKASPGAFQAWLEWTMLRTLEQNIGEERLVFINAWNEWCEGSYLEPDQHFGHGYLQALKNAISNVEAGGGTFAL